MNEEMNKYVSLKEVKKGENKKPTYYFIATKEVVDRDGDIVVVDGIDLSNYQKNPVVLFAHNRKDEPVGKVVDIQKQDGQLVVGIQFADTEKGQNIEYLVSNEYMKTLSIGFRVVELYSDWGYGNPLSQLAKDYPDLFEKYKDVLNQVRFVITKSELTEISVVPVPANPQATLIMVSKGIDRITTICDDGQCKKEIEIPLTKDLFDTIEKAYVRYSEHPKGMKKDTDSSWDKDKAVASLRKWASKDGSGEKDKMDWTKYRKGFTWYDISNIDNFTSYKYPHHWVKDGDFYVVWRGVATAMAYFMKFNKNLPEEDRKGVYNHLAEHYRKDFNKTPPEYKEQSDYTIKELIEQGIDKDTILEYIKLCNEDELYQEFNKFFDEGVEMEQKIKELESKVESLTSEIKEIGDKLQKAIELLNQKTGSPSNVEVENKTEPVSGEEEQKSQSEDVIVVDDGVINSIPRLVSESLKKVLNGGK